MSMGDLRVEPGKAVLLVVDVQERLAAAMPEGLRASCERGVVVLVEMARRLGVPVVVSEQYKKGLGPTVKPIEDALSQPGLQLTRFEKLDFACTAAPEFAPILEKLRAAGRDQWIVAGMETHICVYQSARGLVAAGQRVQVPRDAVCSRTAENRDVGLDLCARAGAVVTATETVVFDALGRAGSDDFKALSRLIK
jgi:nicotinamidase-related amidase